MSPDNTTLKRCTKCGELKPLDSFHRDKWAKCGRVSECKICACRRAQDWADANRDRKRETGKIYREKNHKQRLAAKRAYYWNNKKRHQEQSAIWYRKNRESVLALRRSYAAEHPDKLLEYARQYRLTEQGKALETANRQKRRARKYAAQGTHSKEDLIAIRVAQTDKRGRVRCWWCGIPMERWHVDHKIALAIGGSNGAGNLCLACPRCNLNKKTKTPQEWAGRLF